MSALTIREMRPPDVQRAVALVRSSFSATLLPYMIYGQRGIVAFLLDSVTSGSPDRHYLVAVDDAAGTILGYAEFDLRDFPLVHLSYICVDRKARGQGIAPALIGAFIDSHPRVQVLELDVFTDNHTALKVYRKLSFEEVSTARWTVRELPLPQDHGLTVRDVSTPSDAYSRYGFCMLEVRTSTGLTRLGRMGPDLLRVNDPSTFEDDSLLAGIRSVLPEVTSAIMIAPSGTEVSLASVDYRVLVTTFRLRRRSRQSEGRGIR